MKKLTLVIACLVMVINGFGQRISAGPKVGINFSDLSNADRSETLTGLNAGGFFVYSVVEHFGICADVLYSGEGAKYSTNNVVGDQEIQTDFKLRLKYIRVPLLANVFFGSLGDKVRPKISLGPSFGFLAGVENSFVLTTIENGNVTSAEFSNSDNSDYSSFDLSAIIGAGLNFQMGTKTWLNLDARYSIGATDIFDVKQEGRDPIKNNVFSVGLGLAFGLSGE